MAEHRDEIRFSPYEGSYPRTPRPATCRSSGPRRQAAHDARNAHPRYTHVLLLRQRADGGWAQTDHLAADAYATGEALWALHECGMRASDPVYLRGVGFLLRTQQRDASWHVASRALKFQPYFERGFPHGPDQWISQAGTGMAVIALSFAAE